VRSPKDHYRSLRAHSLDDRYRSSRECRLSWWLVPVIERVFTLPKTLLVRKLHQNKSCATNTGYWERYVPLSRSGSRCREMITLPMALTGHWEVVEWGLAMLSRTHQYLYLELSCLQRYRYWSCSAGQYLESWIPWDNICPWADSILWNTISWPCARQTGPNVTWSCTKYLGM
jgi:hypothetical protein